MRDKATDADLINAIKGELENSSTADGSDFQVWREDAARYYRARPRSKAQTMGDGGDLGFELFPDEALNPQDDEIEGRSTARSPDVQSMVDQTISQIMPRYRRDILAEYQSMGEGDDLLAEAETKAINKMVLSDGNGYIAIRSALMDATLSGLGATVVYWDDSQKAVIEKYPDPYGLITDETVEALAQSPEQEVKYLGSKDGVASVRFLQPVGDLVLQPIPLENLRLASDATDVDADRSRFIGYETFISVSDLIEQGMLYEDAIALPDAGDIRVDDDREHEDFEHPGGSEMNTNKQLIECWYRFDYDNDDRAERRHVRFSGSTIIHNEEVSDDVDIVLGVGLHHAHRGYGWSLFNKLKETEDIKTEILRQAIDAGRLAIDNRWLSEKGAIDFNTMTYSRAGGHVLVEPGMMDKVMPLTAPDTYGSALQLLEYQDKIRSEVGGNALDMTGENSPVPGSTAHGIERVITSREQFVAEISETFAQTYLKKLFIVVHRVLRKAGAPLELEINGENTTVSASELPERKHVAVDLGPTRQQQAMRQQALSMTLETQLRPEMQSFGITSPQHVYATVTDLLESFEVGNASRYWLNPESDEAALQQQLQEAQMQMQQMDQQLQQMQHELTQFQQAHLDLEQAKLMQRTEEHDDKMDYDYEKLEGEQEYKQDELDLKEHEVRLRYGSGQ